MRQHCILFCQCSRIVEKLSALRGLNYNYINYKKISSRALITFCSTVSSISE